MCRSAPSAKANSGSTSISGYSARPYKYTFLYALELPSTGGNTMFSNMYKAYEAVPEALKEKLTGKKALHIHEYNRARQADHSGDISDIPHYAHPVFITHPDTGRKTLFVDRLMTTRIEGMSQEESSAILDQLYDIGERREFIFEHVWKLGDFLMWDNRCTIHARTDFRKGRAQAAAPLHGGGRAVVRIAGGYLVFCPITASASQVAISGTKHMTTTATIISKTNGITPQTTSRSGMSGAMLLITNRFSPTGG